MNVIPAPDSRSIKRCWLWQPCPDFVRDLASVAHHEAGHIAALEWAGLGPTLSATATATGGAAYHGILPGNRPAGPPDETGEIVASAASMFHAGLMAELLLHGRAWTGPIHYQAEDFDRANEMLVETFGHCSSAGHAFAQRTALHIVSSRWARVQEIADVLVQRGTWP